MSLYVVRHAHAGQRSAWTGDDRIRPLSGRGRSQADGIAALLAERDPHRILSSPATRCIQTVEPLATKLGLAVETDQRLFEGVGIREAMGLVEELTEVDAVVCSHGDVIPEILRQLVAAGMEPDRGLVWQKASVWEIDRADDPAGGDPNGGVRWGRGRYHPPPDRD